MRHVFPQGRAWLLRKPKSPLNCIKISDIFYLIVDISTSTYNRLYSSKSINSKDFTCHVNENNLKQSLLNYIL